MCTRWHWASGICGVLLAQTASAAEGQAAAALAAPAPGVAPDAAGSATPTAAEATWKEPRDQPAAPAHSDAPRERWYGWQLLTSDVTSLVLAAGLQLPELALAGYLVAPPVIHVFHGQYTHALLSAAMRVGLPLLGYGAIVAADKACPSSDGGDLCAVGFVGMGVLIGVSAVGLDAAFAYEPVPPAEPMRVRFAPQIIISDRETRFGLVGSF